MMRYSVLLPTRNGAKFIRDCIESILSQNYFDYELVVSDNANADGTDEIIKEYSKNPRVVSVRLETPVSVTDNWNAAYAASSGDYILMMGDDDLLLPGYFAAMDTILLRHPNAGCVVYNGYSYVAPGSIRGEQGSFYSPFHFKFEEPLIKEKSLTLSERISIVHDMFQWKVRIPLNMQTTLVSRNAAHLIRGGLFQAPFPDHYALNALLISGAEWVFSPERLVIVGVSPKSFGHFVYSNEQKSGLAYLGIDPQFPGQLPGSPLINGMYVWLDRLLHNYPSELDGVRIDRRGYVRRQINAWVMQLKLGDIGWRDMVRRFGLLGARDWLAVALTAVDAESWRRLTRIMSPKPNGAQAQLNQLRALPNVHEISEFARCLSSSDPDNAEERAPEQASAQSDF